MQIYSIGQYFNSNNQYKLNKQNLYKESYKPNLRLLNSQNIDTVSFGNHVKLKQPLIVVLLGPPNSGKSTLLKSLTQYLGLIGIATGNIFRTEVKNKTPLGLKMKEYMDKGELIPDKLCDKLLWQRFKQDDCKNGFVLDGYPRTIKHAKKLRRYLKGQKGTKLKVINLSAEQKLLFKRVSKRYICEDCKNVMSVKNYNPETSRCTCGGKLIKRTDDTPEVFKRRLEVYEQETAPIINFYEKEGNLCEIKLGFPERKPEQTFLEAKNYLKDCVEDE